MVSPGVSPQMNKSRQLLDSQVKALKPGVSDKWISDGNGLYIRVRPSGTKSFVFRRKVNGKTERTTIGQYGDTPPKISLKTARLEAGRLRIQDHEQKEQVFFGGDTPGTFGELLDKYYDEQIEPRYKDPRQVRLYKDNRVPDWLKARVVTTLDGDQARAFRVAVRDWLVKYSKESGPIGANRLLSIIKQTTRYGAVIGYLPVDPLAGLTKKYVGGDESPRARTLTNEEIKKLWATESPHSPLLRFLLLTGQRIGEAQKASWTDIVDDRWHIPAENSKNKKAHWVPIVGATRNLLDELPDNRDSIFATRSTTGTQAWLRRWCDKEKIKPRFTPHDLRRTMVTDLNDLGVEPYVVEKLVNHSMAGVMATYNRAEYASERIAAAEKWADHVVGIVA